MSLEYWLNRPSPDFMVNADTSTITHGLCRECGKGGFLADGLCRDCIQKRAVEEHNDHGNDLRNPMTPPVVRVRKGWGNP